MWNVLIVDDDFGTRKLLNRILRRRANADHAINGREAMAAYELSLEHQEPYHFILLDITMPEMNGLEVLREIRARERLMGKTLGNGIPIIMISGREDQVDKANELGCDAFLLKPISPMDLLGKMKALDRV